MPTIWYEQGFRFSFFSADGGEPPHVHVWKGGGTAKWCLDPLKQASSSGFNARDKARIRHIIRARQAFFLEQWRAFFER